MKEHSLFVCRDCGAHAPRWIGRCTSCGAWGSLESAKGHNSRSTSVLVDLNVVTDDAAMTATGVEEFDRVVGGGLVAGSTTLLFGEPGVGKSTLALALLTSMARAGHEVALASAEESLAQVARRARRLGEVPPGLEAAAVTSVDQVDALFTTSRVLVVVDSVSTLRDDDGTSTVGSVAQVRRVAERLCARAKETGVALLMIGHVTKDGELAGPRALEHLVDTVVRVEGDRRGTLRTLRALKHRFAATGEVGLFEMVGEGLRAWDPTSVPGGADVAVPGVVTTMTSDGSRSFLVELQALVATSSGPSRRVAHQVSSQRLSLMLAVLEARGGLDLAGLDVYAATAAGLSAVEPAADAALALAVASARGNFVVERDLVVIGEVGLAGELRAVSDLERRLREAQRRGARRALVPRVGDEVTVEGLAITRCASLGDVLAAAQPGTL
ncbi:MAG: AAA family ATPase [Acidobacteriota bacterium]|nr:AAA family ATPase [Acidobacteriota bacterium]MDE3107646.1 AAA family ATPase [Acidobacteriota bacterium]